MGMFRSSGHDWVHSGNLNDTCDVFGWQNTDFHGDLLIFQTISSSLCGTCDLIFSSVWVVFFFFFSSIST
jgi:hypothetical protein